MPSDGTLIRIERRLFSVFSGLLFVSDSPMSIPPEAATYRMVPPRHQLNYHMTS